MVFEVFTYGGGELLRLVFNAVAAIAGAGDYGGAMRLAALVGLLWVLIEGAFRQRAVNLPWLLGTVFVYLALMVPRADVIVTDRIDPTRSGVVGNVPLGLAATAGTASLLGDWLTRAYETVFSLPDDLRYHQSGLLFAQHLVEASTRFEVTDPRLAANLAELWQACVFYDILLGLYGWEDLFAAPDLWAFVKARTSQARSFAYTDAGNDRVVVGCREGASTRLDADLTADIDRARQWYGARLVSAPNRAAAIAKFAGAMPVSYQYLSGLSLSAEAIIRQNALANAVRRGVSQWAARTGADAAAQDFALARAEEERRTTYAALGELAARTLPMLRNLFEAFVYAVFPIVFLLLLLPSAPRVAMTYLKAIVWVQLWAPLYAVLHFAVTLFGQAPAESALLLPDGSTVLSLANYTGLRQVMADTALIAGYLSLSIPMISYLVVNQGGAMIANLATKVGQSYEAPVGKGAEEATTGNISLGSTTLGKADWWARSTSPSHRAGVVTRQDAESGATLTETAGGLFAMQRTASDIGVSVSARRVADYIESEALKDAQSARHAAASTYATAVTSTLTQGPTFTREARTGGQYQALMQTTEGQQLQQTLQAIESIGDRIQVSDQFVREHRAEIALAASAGVGVPVLLQQLTATGAVRLSDTQRSSVAEAYQQARDAATSLQIGDALARSRAFADSEAFQRLVQGGDQYARRFDASLQEATRAEQQWQSTLTRERSLEEAVQRMRRWSESVDGDFTQAFVQHLRNETVAGERWLSER
ncbi:MAG: conjugal transfer protein TraG N-terminal domain-containing protein, partial [Chromatiales bacterium]|nr:conjugal transfer protein TraG N-terminal domain-containing protein [Chromatiales bacterium]